MAKSIGVEVVYALPGDQSLVVLELEEGATVRDAIERSGLPRRHPELETGRPGLGIFGKPVKPGTLLRDGDRVELYRPLQADPKQARRARAEKRGRKNRP